MFGKLTYSRYSSYKSDEQARRAFYKYVAKEGFYSKMRNGLRPPRKNPFRDGYFEYGYPLWEATRSEIRSRWERKWDKDRYEEVILGIKKPTYEEYLKQRERENLEYSLQKLGTSSARVESTMRADPFEEIPAELVHAKAYLLAIRKELKKTKKPKP